MNVKDWPAVNDGALAAQIHTAHDWGRIASGVWYGVDRSGNWVDMSTVMLVCVPALRPDVAQEFDVRAGAAGGAGLRRFSELHGVTFGDVLGGVS